MIEPLTPVESIQRFNRKLGDGEHVEVHAAESGRITVTYTCATGSGGISLTRASLTSFTDFLSALDATLPHAEPSDPDQSGSP